MFKREDNSESSISKTVIEINISWPGAIRIFPSANQQPAQAEPDPKTRHGLSSLGL